MIHFLEKNNGPSAIWRNKMHSKNYKLGTFDLNAFIIVPSQHTLMIEKADGPHPFFKTFSFFVFTDYLKNTYLQYFDCKNTNYRDYTL